jgi:hypothetical protein
VSKLWNALTGRKPEEEQKVRDTNEELVTATLGVAEEVKQLREQLERNMFPFTTVLQPRRRVRRVYTSRPR